MNNQSERIGLWIDIKILNSDLKPIEKIILADIISLRKSDLGYIKTDKTIANTFNVSIRTVGYGLRNLIDKGFITSKVTRPYGSVKSNRVIRLVEGWEKNKVLQKLQT